MIAFAPATLTYGAASASSPHAKVDLISEVNAIQPGRILRVGLHFTLEKGWHIYWINPGDSGEPPRIQWLLPEGFRAGAIQWPAPRRIPDHSLIDYGYEEEALLIVPISIPSRLQSHEFKLGATAKWLVCRDSCIPEQTNLNLSLPVRDAGSQSGSPWHRLFVTTQEHIPKPAPKQWKLRAMSTKDQFTLDIRTGKPERQAVFFPLEPDQIENAAPQEVSSYSGGVRISLRKSDQLMQPISTLRGVIVMNSGQAYVIAAPIAPSNSPNRRNRP
jgi:DsbC/DsbD-like thiol-disulfide interchange protein